MKVMKAPSWINIIISGLTGGLVNYFLEDPFRPAVGILVFMVLTSIGIVIENKLGYRK